MWATIRMSNGMTRISGRMNLLFSVNLAKETFKVICSTTIGQM